MHQKGAGGGPKKRGPGPASHNPHTFSHTRHSLERDGRIVHRHALALHLGRVHPVHRGAHVGQARRARPHQVGQRLAQRQPRHGGGVDEAFDGLLADGGGEAGQVLVRLGEHGDV